MLGSAWLICSINSLTHHAFLFIGFKFDAQSLSWLHFFCPWNPLDKINLKGNKWQNPHYVKFVNYLHLCSTIMCFFVNNAHLIPSMRKYMIWCIFYYVRDLETLNCPYCCTCLSTMDTFLFEPCLWERILEVVWGLFLRDIHNGGMALLLLSTFPFAKWHPQWWNGP